MDMKVYLARQPIFREDKTVYGYELLYRNSEANFFPGVDGYVASKELIANMLSEFEFRNVTNAKFGFINLDKQTLFSDVVLLLNPSDIILEILEDVEVDSAVIERIKELKEKGYTIALDDFVDDGSFNDLIDYIDIIKADYSLVSSEKRAAMPKKYKGKMMLAEKIETAEEFESAIEEGYTLFQGYHFSKPMMLSKSSVQIASSTYGRMLKEVERHDMDYNRLASIVELDASMIYKLLVYANSSSYYRGFRINSVQNALVRLGATDIRKWVFLLLLRDMSGAGGNEFAKKSLIRATIGERIIRMLGHEKRANDMYLVGMMSTVLNVMEDSLVELLSRLELSENIRQALERKDKLMADIMDCIRHYEDSNWVEVENFCTAYGIDSKKILEMYMQAVTYADNIFRPDSKRLV